MLAAVAAVGIGTAVAVSAPDPLYTVERVVDGDTIVVADPDGGEAVRVRLLNVDTPEMGAKGTLEGCYAQEATDFLTQRLPAGTQVRLELDEEETDRYGRTLAGVIDPESDSLINADIARGGYGVAMLIEPNGKFYPEVLEAEEDARHRGRGMHAPSLGCSLSAQAALAEQALDDEEPAALADAAAPDLDVHRSHVRTVRADVDRLRTRPGPEEDEDGHAVRRHYLDAGQSRVEAFDAEASRLLDEIDAEEDRRAAEERERLERELERQRVEQERRDREAAQAAEAAAAAERSRVQRESQYTAPPAPPARPAPPAPAPAPAKDTYTGCRDYGTRTAPNAVDDKGRPYTRIDCTTKLPI
ncbi:Thermonuclease precursor [Corynebacterium guangdongense]|nr:Thermonuclease precursor [Corynebacterium guangdongense]